MTGLARQIRTVFGALCCLTVFLALSGCQSVPSAPKEVLSPAQVAVLKQQGFQLTDNGWTFGAGDKLLFDTGKDELRPSAREIVMKIGRALIAANIQRVRVEGHTDSVGSDAYNQQLSLRRADVVADALVAGGMSRADMTVVGLGDNEPVADNRSASGRQENRRVAIIVSTQ